MSVTVNTYAYPVAACWFAFVAYWVISAFSAKRNLAGSGFRRGMYVRLATIVAVIAVLHFTRAGNLAPHAGATPRDYIWDEFFSNALVRSIGVALCALGIALAIWARIFSDEGGRSDNETVSGCVSRLQTANEHVDSVSALIYRTTIATRGSVSHARVSNLTLNSPQASSLVEPNAS